MIKRTIHTLIFLVIVVVSVVSGTDGPKIELYVPDDVEKELDCGCSVIVDGSRGKVIISPDKKMQDYYQKKIENI